METLAKGRNIRQQIENEVAIVPDVLSSSIVDRLVIAIEEVFRRNDSRSDYAMRNLTQSVPDGGG